jgi:putative transcriptional regulator
MSKAANSIRQGLEEAVAYAKGRGAKKGYRVHVPEHVDVKAIRTKLGLTQQAFAGRFGFSINTLRHWEQGKREPEGQHARTCSSSIAPRGPFKGRSGSHSHVEVFHAVARCARHLLPCHVAGHRPERRARVRR